MAVIPIGNIKISMRKFLYVTITLTTLSLLMLALTAYAFVAVSELVVGCIAAIVIPKVKFVQCGTSCAETWSIHNIDDNIIRDYRDENYRRCQECGEYYSFDDMTHIGNGDYVCQDCLEEHYCLCNECDDVIDAV